MAAQPTTDRAATRRLVAVSADIQDGLDETVLLPLVHVGAGVARSLSSPRLLGDRVGAVVGIVVLAAGKGWRDNQQGGIQDALDDDFSTEAAVCKRAAATSRVCAGGIANRTLSKRRMMEVSVSETPGAAATQPPNSTNLSITAPAKRHPPLIRARYARSTSVASGGALPVGTEIAHGHDLSPRRPRP